MRLSQEAIEEFKEIYARHFGETLSDDNARNMAERFIDLMEIICRPIPGVIYPIEKNIDSQPKA